MVKIVISRLRNNISSVLLLIVLIILLFLISSIRSINHFDIDKRFDELSMRLDEIARYQFRLYQEKHPKVKSNQDFHGKRTNFEFSPDKKYISFVQNVFDEYGDDWNKYWALKVFNLETGKEKILVVDDTKMSSYMWLSNKTLQVFHDAGTGFRVYLKVSVEQDPPLFTKEHEGSDLWIVDEKYSQNAKDVVEAERIYYEKIGQTRP